MSSQTETVEVAVPIHTAYNQWTQFEQFPKFMKRVKEVRQINDTLTHWTVEINGVRREFDAQITEQQPDSRVAWMSTSGTRQGGTVTFQPIDSDHTRVTAQLDLEPEGFAENVADKTGMVGHHVKEDLENFKEFIEQRGSETGAWRGSVEGGRVESGRSGLAGDPGTTYESQSAYETGAPRQPGMPDAGMPDPGMRGQRPTGEPGMWSRPDDDLDRPL
ncbi:MAG: SRPBCC family protein [Hamadaea sp.]|nr:SRPBCC family protein [Hamadaea sp.]NUR52638.1 SRPBCC family protein [Hamadaea sp.]NUT03779.1 SRPBCC family protein [Hamadaea sp.]